MWIDISKSHLVGITLLAVSSAAARRSTRQAQDVDMSRTNPDWVDPRDLPPAQLSPAEEILLAGARHTCDVLPERSLDLDADAPLDRHAAEECEFGDPFNSDHFHEVFVDCYGEPLQGTDRWFRANEPFEGKAKSRYSMPLSTGRVDYPTANSYCRNIPMDGTYLWCPISDAENFYLWWHHHDQPFGEHNGPSVWTGITRDISTSIFADDGYTCNGLFDVLYRNWLPIAGTPSFVDFFFLAEWNIVLTCNTPHWNDINSITGDNSIVICEMMCDTLDIPDTTEPPATTTTEAGGDTSTVSPPTPPTGIPPDVCEVESNTGVHTFVISVPNGLQDVLDTITCTPINYHGCHCVKLGAYGFTVTYAGGTVSIDSVDAACKKWHDARRCITLPGGSCHETFIDESEYVLEVDYDNDLFDCSHIPAGCLRDLCLIDTKYAAQIASMQSIVDETFAAIIGNYDTCPKCEFCVPALTCSGTAPDLYLVK